MFCHKSLPSPPTTRSGALQTSGTAYTLRPLAAQMGQLVAHCVGVAPRTGGGALLGPMRLLWPRPRPWGQLGGDSPRSRPAIPSQLWSPGHTRDLPRLLPQAGPAHSGIALPSTPTIEAALLIRPALRPVRLHVDPRFGAGSLSPLCGQPHSPENPRVCGQSLCSHSTTGPLPRPS